MEGEREGEKKREVGGWRRETYLSKFQNISKCLKGDLAIPVSSVLELLLRTGQPLDVIVCTAGLEETKQEQKNRRNVSLL